MKRPEEGEFNPYYKKYMDQVKGNDAIDVLEKQLGEAVSFLKSIPQDKETYRYADGKWSIREVLGHIIDTEMIFAGRALRISRNDKTPNPSFEENDYVENSNAGDHELALMTEQFVHVRNSTIMMFRLMNEEMRTRTGTASGNPLSVRAAAWVIAGHLAHHINIIRERYL